MKGQDRLKRRIDLLLQRVHLAKRILKLPRLRTWDTGAQSKAVFLHNLPNLSKLETHLLFSRNTQPLEVLETLTQAILLMAKQLTPDSLLATRQVKKHTDLR